MLSEPTITAFLPTTRPEESKQFYQRILGLNLISEDDYALEFEGNGTRLRITVVDEFEPHPFTVLGFKIVDLVSQVESLTKKGVVFERYASLEQDEFGVWIAPSMAKIAWFKDPDGNLVSLTEYA